MRTLAFIHLERASETEPTFPIEVYCNVGESGGIGWLVNPSAVERWRNWPMPFIQHHFITSKDLAGYGTSPEKVCREFEERARRVMLHSVDVDGHAKLLNELYGAGVGTPSPIQLADARSAFICILQQKYDPKTAERLLANAFEAAAKSRPIRDGAFAIPFLETIEAECFARLASNSA